MISGTGRPQENRISRFLNINNKIAFYPNRNFFSQMFIALNVGSDGKIKILMIYLGTLKIIKTVFFNTGHFSTTELDIFCKRFTVIAY